MRRRWFKQLVYGLPLAIAATAPADAAPVAVTVGSGQTVTIPGDRAPADVLSISVTSGGSLAVTDVDLVRSINGSVVTVTAGQATFEGGSVKNTSTAAGSNAVVARTGGTITATDLVLEANGIYTSSAEISSGAMAMNGGVISLTGGSITTSGNFGYGARTYGDAGLLELEDVDVVTQGYQGIGVQAYGNHDSATTTTPSR